MMLQRSAIKKLKGNFIFISVKILLLGQGILLKLQNLEPKTTITKQYFGKIC